MKKIQVRIALAVDPDGDASAAVIPDGKPWDEVDYILDLLKEGERRYIVAAEVEVPDAEIHEVAGKVEDVESDRRAAGNKED